MSDHRITHEEHESHQQRDVISNRIWFVHIIIQKINVNCHRCQKNFHSPTKDQCFLTSHNSGEV